MPVSKYSFGLEEKRFNRTTAKAFAFCVKKTKDYRYFWIFLCDCGTWHISDARSAFRGMVQSCGCLSKQRMDEGRYKHGHAMRTCISREMNSWKKMKGRVDNPNNEWAHRYSGRGIFYCKGFAEFTHFLKVMGSRPENTSLDRTDNNGSYTCGQCSECLEKGWPLNCRWATPKEQSNNTYRSPQYR